jgi:hypothetical protein
MKMRMIKLNPDFLMQTLQGKTESFASNLPRDVELLDVKYDLFSNAVIAIIRSETFDDLADTYPIPEFNIAYAKIPKNETKPAIGGKLEAKSTKKARIHASQDVKAVEEEFSPDQRELLNFTIDGDFIVVKPIEYLKAEWNEINDVVRSLGGRWVKGDFNSYWEIPIQ